MPKGPRGLRPRLPAPIRGVSNCGIGSGTSQPDMSHEEFHAFVKRMKTDPESIRPQLWPPLPKRRGQGEPAEPSGWPLRTRIELDNEDWRVLPPEKVGEFFEYLRSFIPPEDTVRRRQLEAVERVFALRNDILR